MFGFKNHPSPAEEAPDLYAPAREAMIEHQLRRRGVVMHAVLEAMRQTPRHLFIPHEQSSSAYEDQALPVDAGQTISQPYMVGIMTQELQLRPGMRVLEIGTGTGYQAAILSHLVGPTGRVHSIERIPELADAARRRLESMGITNVEILCADGSNAWPHDPSTTPPSFDRIIVTAGAPATPEPLLEQLADNGILVAPIGPAESQMLLRFERSGGRVTRHELFPCRFVPLVGAHGWPSAPSPSAPDDSE